MSFSILRGILNSHLNTFASAQTPALAVSWENRSFEPPENAPYLHPHLLLSSPMAAGLGDDADDYQRGTYQVDVVGVPRMGWGGNEAIVDNLRSSFARGTRLSGTGVDVVIESVSRGPETIDGVSYKVPVDITFYAHMRPA